MNIQGRRLAVVFPGIGYHADKPLLYYSRKLAAQQGYEIICADYRQLPSGAKGDAAKMRAAYELALSRVNEQLAGVDFAGCSRVLFLSKSLGTAVAAACDAQNRIGAGHVYYTPVAASFQAIGSEGIAFHGTADDWAETEVIVEECRKRNLPLFLTEGANHSMETGDALRDLEIMKTIMEETERYIQEFSARV